MRSLALILALLFAWSVPANAGVGARNMVSFANSYKAPYIGQVVTGTRFPDTPCSACGPFTTNVRYAFVARDNIHSLSVFWSGTYLSATGVETAAPGTQPITNAYIEYPAGTCTPLLFGGSASGTIPTIGTLQSDFLKIYIPNGATAWIREWFAAANNFSYNANTNGPVLNTALGDGVDFNATNDVCATITNTGTGGILPIAVIGLTKRPSFELNGDSRFSGLEDSFNGTDRDLGDVARTIGPQYAYANWGRSGAYASNFAAGVRTSMQKYFSHVVNNLGVNDAINIPATPAQILGYTAAIYNLFPGKPIYQATMEANTTSTDNWVTTANQTGTSATTTINTVDGDIRNMTQSPRGVLDVTNALNSSRTSGLWNVLPGSTAITNDGLHCIQVGCLYIQSQKVINNQTFVRRGPK